MINVYIYIYSICCCTICMYVCMYVWMYVCMYTYIYIYIYIGTVIVCPGGNYEFLCPHEGIQSMSLRWIIRLCIYIYIYTQVYTYVYGEPPVWRYLSTPSFHNFKSQSFKLSVSNPRSKSVACLSVLSQISNCQGLGRKHKFEIMKTDRNACVLQTWRTMQQITEILDTTKQRIEQTRPHWTSSVGQIVRAYTYIHVYIYIYIYTHICIYIYIYAHICIIWSISSSSSSSSSRHAGGLVARLARHPRRGAALAESKQK